MTPLASAVPFLAAPVASTPLPATTVWDHAPLIVTLLAATAVLVVIVLDLRRLSRAASITAGHRIAAGGFAAAIVGLTLVMAVSLESPGSAMAVDTDAPASVGTPDGAYFDDLQLPTLPTE